MEHGRNTGYRCWQRGTGARNIAGCLSLREKWQSTRIKEKRHMNMDREGGGGEGREVYRHYIYGVHKVEMI